MTFGRLSTQRKDRAAMRANVPCATEVLRRGKPGLVHWVAPHSLIRGELETNTGCGLMTTGMVSSYETAEAITCEGCQTEYAAMKLRSEEMPRNPDELHGEELDVMAMDRLGIRRRVLAHDTETDPQFRDRMIREMKRRL
jgi:hypothetical protein